MAVRIPLGSGTKSYAIDLEFRFNPSIYST